MLSSALSQLHVAVVARSFPEASETFVMNLVRGLIDRGHAVDILANRGGRTPDDPVLQEYRLTTRTTYRQSLPPDTGRRIIGAVRHLRAFMRNPRRLAEVLNVGRYGRLAASLELFYAALPLADKALHDVYHFQFGTAALEWFPLIRSGFLRAPIVVSFRGYDISRHVKEHGPGVYAGLFERSELLLANCEFFRQRLIALGADPARTVVYRSGIDCRRFPFAPPPPDSSGALRITVAGRLVEKKGVAYVLKAVARLRAAGRPVECHVVGDGPLRSSLERLAGEMGIAAAVMFHGWQSQDQLADRLRKSDVFVAASVTAQDGDQDAPVNTLKEAMATGLPVIGTRHGGIPELVEDGRSGFLVPERDADALADRLACIHDRPEQRTAMGWEGRAAVERDYDLSKLSIELEMIYRRAVATYAAHNASSRSHLGQPPIKKPA